MDGILQLLPFCEIELWKWKFRILKRLLKRGILSKSIRLLPFLIQICSFRKAIQSLIYPIVQTRQFVLFATDKNPLEFPDVMKMWISFCALSRGIQLSLLMLARKRDFGPVNLNRQSGNTNPREKMMSWSRDIRYEKRFILLTRGGGRPSKSASQTRAADQIRLGPSFKGICAVPTHQSAPEKREGLSRYPWINGSRQLS